MWTYGHVYVFWDIICMVICWDDDKYVSSFNMQNKKWKLGIKLSTYISGSTHNSQNRSDKFTQD